MNTKFIASAVVALSALAGASAFAQSSLSGEAALAIRPDVSASNVTRAQVQANYLAARQAGAVAVSQEAAFAAAPVEASTLTRAAVREEAAHYVILDGSNRKIYR
ncbi:MAG: DUF4148 domain-containing protein [Pseudomonadota bacterium]